MYMANLFDDFNLDIQKISTEYETPSPASQTLTLWCIITMYMDCNIEVGKTSDQCGSQNCTNLSYCAGQ